MTTVSFLKINKALLKGMITGLVLIFQLLTVSAQIGFEYDKDYKAMLSSTADSAGGKSYKELLKRFKHNDSTLTSREVLALMIGFTAQPEYLPFDDLETEKSIFDLNEHGNYEEAINESNIYLSSHPLSLRILKEKSYSLHQLRIPDSTEYYLDLTDKIMAAMKYSGNGRFPERAIFSLGLADGEYYSLNRGLAISIKATGKNKEGQMLEMITVMKEDGDRLNMYFNIDHAINSDKKGKVVKTKKKSKKKDKPAADTPEDKIVLADNASAGS